MLKHDAMPRKAEVGERIMEAKVRFWTNKIAEGEGEIYAKDAWGSGVVRMERNTAHGIRPRNPRPFQSLPDLARLIEKVLIEHGITIHRSPRMRKYMSG